MLPTVSAKVTFTDFTWAADMAEGLAAGRFEVPASYTLDPYR